MKKIAKKLLMNLCAVGLSFIAIPGSSQTISTHYFGQNAWMPDTLGNSSACTEPPCIFNGMLNQEWGNVKQSKAALIRYGGTAADKNMPTNYQYIRIVDSIRANGMEPVLQVPFCNNRYTSAQAAAIVKYVNITMGKNVKYWIIGNEPDLAYSYTTSAQVAAYIRPFSSAMKSVDPSIIIIGPELSYFNKTIMDGLTTPSGADDITGKDANGRYYLDIISYHKYPFNGSQTLSEVQNNESAANSLASDLTYLNTRVAACNSAHSRTGSAILKTALTEANIDYQNSSTDNLSGVGANSFLGGQFIAEMLGTGLQQGLDFMSVWSVVEGSNDASNIGYIDPKNSSKKPSYYHYQMMAENFSGNSLKCSTNQANVKSFGSQNGQGAVVLILNEDQASSFNYTVNLNTAPLTTGNPLIINVTTSLIGKYEDVIPAQSTILLTFNSTGQLIRKCEYSLLNQATAGVAPTCTDVTVTGIAAITAPAASDFNVFPNPASGKFTIDLGASATIENPSCNVTILNMEGQEVYNKELTFQDNKQDIELDGSIADGAYIVHVKDSSGKVYTRKMVIRK